MPCVSARQVSAALVSASSRRGGYPQLYAPNLWITWQLRTDTWQLRTDRLEVLFHLRNLAVQGGRIHCAFSACAVEFARSRLFLFPVRMAVKPGGLGSRVGGRSAAEL